MHCAIPSKSGDFAGKKLIFDVSRQKSKKQAQLAYHCNWSDSSPLSRSKKSPILALAAIPKNFIANKLTFFIIMT